MVANAKGSGQNQVLDEALNQTELGAFISKYKIPVFVVLILGVLGVFGYGIYNQVQSKTHDEYNSKIDQFRASSLKDFQDELWVCWQHNALMGGCYYYTTTFTMVLPWYYHDSSNGMVW